MMKTTGVAVPLICALSTRAWDLTITATDGRSANMHGWWGLDCENMVFFPPLNIKHVTFHETTFAHTFELFTDDNCKRTSYVNSNGDFDVVPRVVRSYRIY